MNLVIQLGHLTRDPEIRQTGGGTSVLNCAIATNRSVSKGDGYVDEATFVEFTMWGKRAEAFARHHSKGTRAFIKGRLTMDSWEDRSTGQQRSKLKMTAEEWEFVNDKGERTGQNDAGPVASDDTPF